MHDMLLPFAGQANGSCSGEINTTAVARSETTKSSSLSTSVSALCYRISGGKETTQTLRLWTRTRRWPRLPSHHSHGRSPHHRPSGTTDAAPFSQDLDFVQVGTVRPPFRRASLWVAGRQDKFEGFCTRERICGSTPREWTGFREGMNDSRGERTLVRGCRHSCNG